MIGKAVSTTQVAYSTPFDNSTNGFVATNVQEAIVETAIRLTASEVSATATATTGSTSDVLLTGMTTTPAAGSYLVWFSSSVQATTAGASATFSLYVGGTRKADSERIAAPLDGGLGATASAIGTIAINGIVVVNGAQAIDVRWKTSAGNPVCGTRTLNLLRIL